MKNILTLSIILLSFFQSYSNNIQISDLIQNGNTVTFNISWENSWRSTLEFHDAVWIFIKQAPNGGSSWIHGNISNGQIDQGYELTLPNDHVGIFIRRANDGNGTASAQVQLTLENAVGAYRDIRVYGIEMVYIPQGPFYVGDGISEESLYLGSDTTTSYYIDSEAEITVGNGSGELGGLDNISTIPSTFPKGYAPFYTMKYNFSQKQIVDFLNTLSEAAQNNLLPVNLDENPLINVFVLTESTFPILRNGIRTDATTDGPHTFYNDLNNNGIYNEEDDGQSLVCNEIRQSFILSYLDWSGLAPMTRLEYEKLCRGPLPAVPGEYPWGSTVFNNSSDAILNPGSPTETTANSGLIEGLVYSRPRRSGINALPTTTNRALSGATYYGVMDMYSSVTSQNIPLLSSNMNYNGEHGNGMLDSFGNSDIYSFSAFYTKTYNHKQVSASGIPFGGQALPDLSGRGVRRL